MTVLMGWMQMHGVAHINHVLYCLIFPLVFVLKRSIDFVAFSLENIFVIAGDMLYPGHLISLSSSFRYGLGMPSVCTMIKSGNKILAFVRPCFGLSIGILKSK